MIVGFRIDRVECKRNVKPEEIKQYRVGYNIDIKKREIIKKKNSVLRISYEFLISYFEDIGHIRVSGALHYSEDVKKLKEIDKKWGEMKDIQAMVFNSIFASAIPIVMDISRHLALPSPVLLPTIKPEDLEK
jgi:hypothetical protein